jgi:hypothetical protein
MNSPALEPDYKAELIGRILYAVAKGARDFKEIVRSAEGAYPSDILALLRELEREEKIPLSASGLWGSDDGNDAALSRLARSQIAGSSNTFDNLPEPHPLDFDWRFTPKTLSDLGDRLRRVGANRVAVLGAPTLYKQLVQLDVTACLFDKNREIVRHLKSLGYTSVVECDLLSASHSESTFEWAFADPPWYLDYYQGFLKAARGLLMPEGRLLLSVLPRLTRPSASSDRLRIVEYAADVGFDLIEANPAQLHYSSPPFEIEALEAEGLVIGDWRAGDLFSFVLRSRPLRHIADAGPSRSDQWYSAQLGNMTIRVRIRDHSELDSFSYEPVSASGNIRFHSVSRRSLARSEIDLWTSRNLALKITKAGVLVEALEKIKTGEPISGVLASVVYEYQLTPAELEELQGLIHILMVDAGLWSS